ncbi:ATP-dependent DNA helicase Q1-like isoform X2 [Salvelinus fontinalis]|uniref:ATP-dependent DNA helicase Q1-like isoform X2 n=1 Tax=Salvelinus fontinalis TaxID=8038 RepID=UPI0024868154|nr:ATP-dependent DNA helicase Q1-like isoform X2 [Salvelinus fontinalis]
MDSTKDVQAELDSVEAKLEVVELQIAELLKKQASLTSKKKQLLGRLEEPCDSTQPSGPAMTKQELLRYEKDDFSWSTKLEQNLKDVFQLSKFRPLQLKAINLSMSGKDLFLVMPTGRGKSLCYQLPAVCSEGFTLVVTPLVSLMEDQLMYLKSIDVEAVSLNASSSKEHAKMVLAEMTDTKAPFKLLYVTPEKIAKSKLLMSRLEKAYNAGRLSRIAVDEVHCCSQWGHDFRPDYKLLGILKRQFPKVPLLGLTATATSSVLKDCQKILCVPEPITLTASFNRTNLYYEVRLKDSNSDDSISDISTLIKERYKDQSGIVYVFSQKDAETVSADLQKKGLNASPYHANMSPEDKSQVHRKWATNKIQVVVATVAFGMGIDKADVRFVIHHTISKSIENYYQESGRAGRDDKPADCIVYFGFNDIFRISTMVVMENVGQQKLLTMVDYCQNVDRCRRSVIAVHFDEVWNDEGCNEMCDVCRHGNDYITVDITQHAKDLVQIVELAGSLDEKLTPLKVTEAWMGKGPAKRRKMIQTTTLSRLEVEAIITSLLLQGYLSEDFSFTPYTTYFYLKLGRKAPLLKNQSHSITMKMRRTGLDANTEDQLAAGVKEVVVTSQSPPPVAPNDSSPPPHRHNKLIKMDKEQQNLARKQDKDHDQTECQTGYDQNDTAAAQPTAIEVDVEINIIEKVNDSESPLPPLKLNPKPKSTTPQKKRRKPCTTAVPAPSEGAVTDSDHRRPALVNSPSQVSIISEAAVEELCDLRNYYSKQLRRINYISHEYLKNQGCSDPGVLACIREPLKSLRLPRGSTITRTARNLWTRVSSRRKPKMNLDLTWDS